MSEKVKKPFYKKWWFWVLAVIVIFGAIGNMDNDEDTAEQDNETAEEASATKEDSDDEDENDDDDKDDEKEAELTHEEKLKKENTSVDEAKLENGSLTLIEEATSSSGAKSILNRVYSLFEVLPDAFEDDEVDEIEVIIKTTLLDQKGNESLEPVAKYTYTRDAFEELNYDNFTSMAVTDRWRIFNESDAYFIHPVVYDDLDSETKNNLSHDKSKVRQHN